MFFDIFDGFPSFSIFLTVFSWFIDSFAIFLKFLSVFYRFFFIFDGFLRFLTVYSRFFYIFFGFFIFLTVFPGFSTVLAMEKVALYYWLNFFVACELMQLLSLATLPSKIRIRLQMNYKINISHLHFPRSIFSQIPKSA